MYLSLLFASFFVGAVVAVPAGNEIPFKTIEKRATTICGQWDSVATGTYTLYQDLWGESAATSGSQCSTYISLSGNTISWSTSWTWAGGSSSVKSFANVVLTQATGVQLSTISSIPSVWTYRYVHLVTISLLNVLAIFYENQLRLYGKRLLLLVILVLTSWPMWHMTFSRLVPRQALVNMR